MRDLRLFFALWPDEATRAALAEWASVMHRLAGGRRVPAEKFHATLAFLGATPESRLAQLTSVVEKVSAAPFELIVDQSGYWKRNRIAWAGASVVPAEVDGLVSSLRDALSEGRVRFDPKPFVPHVTLLRDAAEPRTMPEFAAIRWPISGFHLVQSATDEKGAVYRMLSSWPLRASSS